MKKIGTRVAALALAVFAMAFVASCGDDEGGGGNGGKTGGSIKIGSVLPDKYDPVLYQTIQAYQALHLVYTPLLSFKNVEGAEGQDLIPGLATKLPEITNAGKTYKLTLRKGLKYSDGSPIRASDFENTIKRLLKLGGPFSSFVTPIEGAPEFQEKGDFAADIPGIETNDQTGEITINLSEADTKFQFALAESYTAPTPAAKSPGKSLNNPGPPGYGPYTIDIENPSRQFTLTKNRKFDIPGLAKGNADKMTVIKSSVSRMTQDVINGKLDFMTEDPAGDLLPQVRQKYSDRFRLDANPSNIYYFSLNVTVPPFDKLEARQAVNYAIDSRALVRIFGGRLAPGCTFIPPGVIGFKESTNENCPFGKPDGPGDIEKAKQLVEKSGTKGETVTMWTNNKDPRPAIGDYMRDLLNQIGYKAKVKTLDQQVYFDQLGLKRNKAQIGFTDWYMDFPHPGDLFEPSIDSSSLESEPIFNTSYVADKQIDAKLQELKGKDPKDVEEEWAALDKEVVEEKAYVAVYGYEKASTFMSERMDFENCSGVHPVFKNDWSQFCLK